MKVPAVKISSVSVSETPAIKENDDIINDKKCFNDGESSKKLNRHTETISNSHKCVAESEDSSEHTMDRSVDSIGTCSLDVEVSADLSGTPSY